MQLLYTDCTNSSDCSDITGELEPGESIIKTFSVKNTGTLDASYRIVFKESHNTFVDDELLYNLRYKDSDDNITVGSVPNGNINNMLLTTESIKAGETKEYKLIITWKSIIEGNNESNIGATFNIKLGIENIEDKALPTLSKLQTLNSNIKLSKGEPDFSKAATTDEGVYKTIDDYGYTYYFRGAVENNYVKFAGFYWRIVRINGDGSIRLIYDGTKAHANGDESDDRQIGTSFYNLERQQGSSLESAGYMINKLYENPDKTMDTWIFGSGVKYENGKYILTDTQEISNISDIKNRHYTCFSDSTFCEEVSYVSLTFGTNILYYINLSKGKTIEYALDEMIGTRGSNPNKEDSLVKAYVDKWYETNLINYANYLSDNEFCNDRSTVKLGGSDSSSNDLSTRLQFNSELREKAPILTCPDKNDRFTTSDLVIGNGNLKNPISILSADEGRYIDGSKKGYLYDGQNTWLNTPAHYYIFGIRPYIVWDSGGIGINGGLYTHHALGIKPVISLTSSLEFKGNGTMTNPFEIITT